MPKVSAVMALYNTPYDYLLKTVQSILGQTLGDFEFIIIDDASTVDYERFFKQFNDERIKYFRLEKNSGPGHARNEGIKKANGEYVAIVDSDDIYMPKRFEVQSGFLDENPNISLVSGAFKQSNNGKIPPVVVENEDIKLFMLFNSPFANPLVMLKKDIFSEKNLFYPENINFGEDYQLWIDVMFAGIKMANINQILMIYTRRKNQLSKTKLTEQISILHNLYKNIFSKLQMEISEEELLLHHKIYEQDFSDVTVEEISQHFDKIIEKNKLINIFNEEKLNNKKNEIIKQAEKIKNRLFKIKLGNKNFCLGKNLKIYFEDRN